MEPVDTIDACRTSQRLLLAGLAPLTDDDFRAPSLLPRYSRGHVVTHIAIKSKAHVLIFGGPAAGARTMAEIVAHHLRNIEVHHVDLDIGHRTSDRPPILVEGELSKRLRSFPDRADHAEILAWLLGRAPAPELTGPW
jgi:Mycothiol maleylpyruvate isomerase N-terminal domain